MSLEQLILKYIDGELNTHEDEHLRKLLRDDPDAKEVFESHIELHHAMQNDSAEISVPNDLYTQTEDLIMMKIMSEETDNVMPIENTNNGRKTIFLSIFDKLMASPKVNFGMATALLLLFFGIRNIDESEMPLIDNQNKEISQNVAQLSSNSNSELDNNSIKKIAIKQRKQLKEQSKLPKISKTLKKQTTLIEMQDFNKDPISISQNVMNENLDIARSELANHNTNSASNTNSSLFIEEMNGVHNNLKPFIALPFNNDFATEITAISKSNSPLNFNQVQISSIAGMDYYRYGVNSNDEINISHVAQSISYSASETDRFGLEFGFTEYTVNNNINVNLPTGVLVVIPGEGGFPVGSNSGLNLNEIQVEVPVRFFWASAFYERTLFDHDGFSLDGRIGAGASAHGPMAYMRLFAKQRIIRGVYFTIGTEGRLFKTDHPIINSDEFNRSASLIYGLQFSF